MPRLGDADRVCFANRSIPALQDKNPSTPIAKRRKHLPYPLFLLPSPPQKKKLQKKKTPTGDFALCGARPSPPTARAAFWKRRAKTLIWQAKTLIWSKSFRSAFFSILCNKIDKNVQSRRISVSSPYNRTAETDFGERKSEYNKNQREACGFPSLILSWYYWKT